LTTLLQLSKEDKIVQLSRLGMFHAIAADIEAFIWQYIG
jgi:hypothetical protein